MFSSSINSDLSILLCLYLHVFESDWKSKVWQYSLWWWTFCFLSVVHPAAQGSSSSSCVKSKSIKSEENPDSSPSSSKNDLKPPTTLKASLPSPLKASLPAPLSVALTLGAPSSAPTPLHAPPRACRLQEQTTGDRVVDLEVRSEQQFLIGPFLCYRERCLVKQVQNSWLVSEVGTWDLKVHYKVLWKKYLRKMFIVWFFSA